MTRVSLSKRTRFEIFKRDGFTCQYCGKRPPEVVLEIDHINPVVNGGNNDPINLITTCFDCNRGKSDKQLLDKSPKPDADIEWLATQQEIAELKRYQDSRNELVNLLSEVADSLQATWAYAFQTDGVPEQVELIRLLKYHIYCLNKNFDSQFRYMCGICWHLVNEKNNEEELDGE